VRHTPSGRGEVRRGAPHEEGPITHILKQVANSHVGKGAHSPRGRKSQAF
jgi:hypothetical protein